MRRMPIPVRLKPFLPRGCPHGMYAGLARVSPGCPPDRGRLHTCYSPVRRSPPGKAEASPALPLDLHVLSLPLAFILSQDQTLRCYILYIFFASVCPASRFQFSTGSTETSISLPCFTLLPTSSPKPRTPPLTRDGRRNTGSMSMSCGIISLFSSLPRRPAASRQRLQNYLR